MLDHMLVTEAKAATAPEGEQENGTKICALHSDIELLRLHPFLCSRITNVM